MTSRLNQCVSSEMCPMCNRLVVGRRRSLGTIQGLLNAQRVIDFVKRRYEFSSVGGRGSIGKCYVTI